MRYVAGFGLLLFLVLAVYWFTASASSKDKPSLEIPIAWGRPAGGQIEMHAIIGVSLAHKSRKNEKILGKPLDWNKWVETHCILKSASGAQVRVDRENNCPIIKRHEIQPMVGTEEFFLTATVKPGTLYTFDYIIELPEPTTFRCQLTPPSVPEKVRMYSFPMQ